MAENQRPEEIPLRESNRRRMHRQMSREDEDYWRSIFRQVDKDKNGAISTRELQRMISEHELTDPPLPPHRVHQIHFTSDTNQDGVLDFEEFVQMLQDPKNRNIFGRYMTQYVNLIVPRKTRRRNQQEEIDETDLAAYDESYSCCPPHLGMILITLIEVAFYIVDQVSDPGNYVSGPMAGTLIWDPNLRQQAWRFLTYMFVHVGFQHLFVNLLVQLFFGIPLEMVHGWWRVLLVYSLGVIAGSLGHSVMDRNTKLAGASGGVYSILTAHVAAVIMNWSDMTFPLIQLLIVLALVVPDTGTSIYYRFFAPQANDHVGYVSHFAGAAAGLLMGIVVLKNVSITSKEKVVWWSALVIYVGLMGAAIFFNIFE